MVQPNAHLQTYLQAVVEKEESDLLPPVTEVITERHRFQALN